MGIAGLAARPLCETGSCDQFLLLKQIEKQQIEKAPALRNLFEASLRAMVFVTPVVGKRPPSGYISSLTEWQVCICLHIQELLFRLINRI